MLITCYGQVKKRNHYDSMDFWVDEAQVLMLWLTDQEQTEEHLLHLWQSLVLQTAVKKK